MMPINIVVFSKDRAMQLELFLRSFNHYVKHADRYRIHVLFTWSDDDYGKGYWELACELSPNIVFHTDLNFKEDLLDLIDSSNPYTVFFVDDDFFKNDFDFYDEQMNIFESDKRILCRSLRLGKDLHYCYSKRKPMQQPTFSANNTFNWRTAQHDFGYPMSLDGHIFRTAEILPMLQTLDYQNPNTLECQLAKAKNQLGELMICYSNSIIMNNPINKVQTYNNNWHGNVGAKELNDLFLKGLIIDLTAFDGYKNVSAHQELKLNFIKP